MSNDERNNVCTVDHANKQSDALGFNAYEYWLKHAEWLKAARQGQPPGSFRRDQENRRKG